MSARWEKGAPKSRWEEHAEGTIEERWRRIREARAPEHIDTSQGVFLGTEITTRRPVAIVAEELSTHMQVVGATGVGKSFFLEGIIKRLIEQGHGLCLMTPHEDIY